MSLEKFDFEGHLIKQEALSEKVKIDETHIVIALPEGRIEDSYEIALSAIKTPEELVAWIFHLSSKSWIDLDVLRKFIRVASEHLNIEL
ncbi:hypothetical protein [Cedecea neteri]|uniref:hypothetical protein n=1 Tax=Cedecea neteri TaxID=158822 RepID=UPI0028992761|nr:hypothetical protein [Cedecea neteri]